MRQSPTGLPTIVAGLALLGLAFASGDGSGAAFLWPVVIGCGAGVMLAIEFGASAAGSACAIAALLAVGNEFAFFDIVTGPLTEASVLSLAVTSGLLATAPAWAMMLAARKRPQGGDSYMAVLVPVILGMAIWALARPG